MMDDPNKKKNEGTGSSGQQSGQTSGQQSGQRSGEQSGQKPGQQSHRDISNESQKRPSHGGNESDQDMEQEEQGGKRRAS